jgi:pyrroline-5-carboxylate reductase
MSERNERRPVTALGIIGMGKMGEAVAQGLAASEHAKDYVIRGTTRTPESASDTAKRLGISCGTDNGEVAAKCSLLLLCVKPHQAERVVREIAPRLTSQHLLVTICASITTAQVSEWSEGRCAVIRSMPNTPCLIGEGMTVFCGGAKAAPAQMEVVGRIFGTLGRTAVIEESLMDGATGLSGCGPAYVYLIIEALSEAGVKVGLPREVATLLAAQTLRGASQMVLARGVHPAALKDEVTTPAGCTIDGLMALEEGKLRVTLIKAVLAAAKRSRSLRAQAEK